jgi:uncharacterized membrane protein
MLLAYWGAYSCGTLGIDIASIRAPVALFTFLMLPGFLILSTFDSRKLGTVSSVIYATALSIVVLMMIGLVLNTILPTLGYERALSFEPVAIACTLTIVTLCGLVILRDDGEGDTSCLEFDAATSIRSLAAMSLIPFSVISVYVYNTQELNTAQVLLLVMIAAIPVLIGILGSKRTTILPIALVSASLALLLHTSMVTSFLVGCDIQGEYYLASQVINDGQWTSSIATNVNAVLSIVILAPMITGLSGVSLTLVLKFVYPLLFSLVPLGIYEFAARYVGRFVSFFSVFFFISIFTFYGEMVQLARVEIAELFLVALLIALGRERLELSHRNALALAFSAGLIFSHYGLAYITVLVLVTTFILQKLKSRQPTTSSQLVSFHLLSFFVVLALGWYMYASSSSVFLAIVGKSSNLFDSILSDFFSRDFSQGVGMVTGSMPSGLYAITKYLHLASQVAILAGVVLALFSVAYTRFDSLFVGLAIGNFVVAAAAMALPYFASSLGTQRFYEMTLIVLCPFTVVGGMSLVRWIARTARLPDWVGSQKAFLAVFSVFLSIFLIFNSGLAYELAGDTPFSIALDSEFDYARFTEEEVAGAQWLSSHLEDNAKIYSDDYRYMVLTAFIPTTGGRFIFMTDESVTLPPGFRKNLDLSEVPDGAIIFLGTLNVEEGLLALHDEESFRSIAHVNSAELRLDERNIIFDIGGARIMG